MTCQPTRASVSGAGARESSISLDRLRLEVDRNRPDGRGCFAPWRAHGRLPPVCSTRSPSRPAARRRWRRPRPGRSHRQGDPRRPPRTGRPRYLRSVQGRASPRCGPRLRTSIRGSRHRSPSCAPSCGPGSRTLKPGRPAPRHAEALSDSGRTKMADSRCVVQVPVHRNVIRIRRRGCGVKLDADHQRTRPG